MRYLARQPLTWPTHGREEGQGMLEYGLIIMLVALVVFSALTALGPQIAKIYNTAANSL